MKYYFSLLIALGLYAGESLPTNFSISPYKAKGSVFMNLNPQLQHRPSYLAGQAVSIQFAHDKNTLLILTSGYNRVHNTTESLDINASNEYVFIYGESKT
ncbi:MAG: hypothetical protein COA39_012010 [Sulfurimonas sp.]|nr:hypothetical protein [Sulfurimonas sp.]MBL1245082.1 hypothetical protein [Sulfurimonas sp.]